MKNKPWIVWLLIGLVIILALALAEANGMIFIFKDQAATENQEISQETVEEPGSFTLATAGFYDLYAYETDNDPVFFYLINKDSGEILRRIKISEPKGTRVYNFELAGSNVCYVASNFKKKTSVIKCTGSDSTRSLESTKTETGNDLSFIVSNDQKTIVWGENVLKNNGELYSCNMNRLDLETDTSEEIGKIDLPKRIPISLNIRYGFTDFQKMIILYITLGSLSKMWNHL